MQQAIQLGVFWFIDGRIYGQSEAISVRTGNGNDLANQERRFIDTSLEHWRVWETSSLHLIYAPHEYFEFSRGRLLYDQKLGRHRVYCDASLLHPSIKATVQAQISEFFAITSATHVTPNTTVNNASLSLYADEHYTTDRINLDRLFED